MHVAAKATPPDAPHIGADAFETLLGSVRFDDRGLVPVITQDIETGVVRMMAFANEAALRASATNRRATFWSRSRNSLWEKGATSGNSMELVDIRLDCDGDAVLYLVHAHGPSCHTGTTSCFFRQVSLVAPGSVPNEDEGPPPPPAYVIQAVADVIAARRGQSPDSSYVASLLHKGWPKIVGKMAEETAELQETIGGDDETHRTKEAADVLFHTLVGFESAGVNLRAVFDELRRRFGTSGHVEKAARPAKDATP